MEDATERVRRRRWEDPARLLPVTELRRNAPEADTGRARGRVELKDGVEKIEEGGSCTLEGWVGGGGGDGDAGSDILCMWRGILELVPVQWVRCSVSSCTLDFEGLLALRSCCLLLPSS